MPLRLLPSLLARRAAPAQTLEQMAGQMIVVGFQGDDADDESVEALRAEIAAGELGGVMFLKTNVKSLDAVAGDERGCSARRRPICRRSSRSTRRAGRSSG